MAKYQGPVVATADARVEVFCYTGPDATLRLQLYKWAAILFGIFLGFLVVALFRMGGLVILRFIRRFFVDREGDLTSLGRVLIDIVQWLLFNFMWAWILGLILAVLLGAFLGWWLWQRFVNRNFCTCPAGRIGVCFAYSYWILPLIRVSVLTGVHSAPTHCGVIPPGCP